MIEVKECSKAFDTVKAVNKATLDVGVREVFGLVGSNGAGKSTLLRMMAGIIRPDEGEIQIDAALSPDSYSVRVHRNSMLQPSDVWVFPTLDAADISKKLLCMMPSVYNYGLILGGLLFPIAQLPRLTDEDRMFGTALVVGNEAIKFHLLYPQGVAPLY